MIRLFFWLLRIVMDATIQIQLSLNTENSAIDELATLAITEKVASV